MAYRSAFGPSPRPSSGYTVIWRGRWDAEGKPHPVLQAFARPLREHLLSPSGRGGGQGGARAVSAFGGCFTYEPPPGVVWKRIED